MKWLGIGILVVTLSLAFREHFIYGGRSKRKLRKAYAKKKALTKTGK